MIYAWEACSHDTMRQSPHTDLVPGRTHMYTLDRVYGAESTTQQLYETSVQHLVHSALEGYHTAVLAYGQTSTGKTHTMTGTPTEPGLIPLCLQECFAYLQRARSLSPKRRAREDDSGGDCGDGDGGGDQNNPDKDDDVTPREYLLRLSYLEIYKEHIRDLLNPSKTAAPIRLFDSADGLIIKGLTEHVVTSPQQVFKYLAQGEARRQVGCTHMNQHSSRSHVMVRLWMESKPMVTNNHTNHSQPQHAPLSPTSSLSSETHSIRNGYPPNSNNNNNNSSSSSSGVRISSLSLVDLAGSESVKLNGSNDRRQEGHYINKSLMTLGQVVYALSEGTATDAKLGNSTSNKQQQHVPYRDSKLTRLLQPSLSGNAQVVLICCISPLVQHIEESHNTFKFATRAKKIPQRATITEAGLDEKTLLQTYRDEIEELKQQLRDAQAAQAALLKQQQERQQQQQQGETSLHTNGGNGNGDLAGGVPSSSTLSLASEVVDEDEIAQLIQSIQTMERLILKTKPVAGDDHPAAHQNATNGLGQATPGARAAPEDLLDETVLSTDADDDFDTDEENLLALTDSNSIQPSNSFTTPPRLVRVASSSITDTDRDLHAELKRVQGLLGSVLQKKRSTAAAITATMTNNNNNEQEVRQLREQLEQQEVATYLRKADSSFLQKQLEEKDKLLAEVSQILQAMEDKQMRLEEENAALKRQVATLTNES